LAAGDFTVLRDCIALVCRGADAESAILSRIYPAAQSGALSPAICITTANRSGITCPVTALALVPWTVFVIAAIR
jgi:hypothetical protein